MTAEGLVESALDKVHLIENMGYDNLVVSIKSSDVMMCVKAHELLAPAMSIPAAVGITESRNITCRKYKIIDRTPGLIFKSGDWRYDSVYLLPETR